MSYTTKTGKFKWIACIEINIYKDGKEMTIPKDGQHRHQKFIISLIRSFILKTLLEEKLILMIILIIRVKIQIEGGVIIMHSKSKT
jgi:hypothetical protein